MIYRKIQKTAKKNGGSVVEMTPHNQKVVGSITTWARWAISSKKRAFLCGVCMFSPVFSPVLHI